MAHKKHLTEKDEIENIAEGLLVAAEWIYDMAGASHRDDEHIQGMISALEAAYPRLMATRDKHSESNTKMTALFISYRFGNHYIGVYPSVKYTYEVVKEMMEDMDIKDDFIPIKELEDWLNDADSYWYEFSDGTWITIQPVAEELASKYRLIKKF